MESSNPTINFQGQPLSFQGRTAKLHIPKHLLLGLGNAQLASQTLITKITVPKTTSVRFGENLHHDLFALIFLKTGATRCGDLPSVFSEPKGIP